MQRFLELWRPAYLLLELCYRDPEQQSDRRWNDLIQIPDYLDRRFILNLALFIHLSSYVAVTLVIVWLNSCWSGWARLIAALVYIFIVGHFGSAVFLCALTWFMGQLPESQRKSVGVPGNLMGFFERLLFMGVVWGVASVKLASVPAVAVAMAFWLGTKLLSGWNRAASNMPPQESDRRARGAMSALMAGALNMVFATVGGLIASGDLVL